MSAVTHSASWPVNRLIFLSGNSHFGAGLDEEGEREEEGGPSSDHAKRPSALYPQLREGEAALRTTGTTGAIVVRPQ